jgi:dihydrofolate reductase
MIDLMFVHHVIDLHKGLKIKFYETSVNWIVFIKDNMKLPRKLKKRIIQVFGRETYDGIANGYLSLEKYHKNTGVVTARTNKPMGSEPSKNWFHARQHNPYLTFPKIKFGLY